MTDEEYVFRQDVRDKAITARSARKTGNAGKRRMPVQQMTRKEWEKMNGPIFAMKMNEPMRWDEFKELPQHMQKQYMDGIMAKYEIGSTAIGKMLGISQSYAGKILRGLDIPVPVHPRRSEVDRFMNEFCSPKAEPGLGHIFRRFLAAGDRGAAGPVLPRWP